MLPIISQTPVKDEKNKPIDNYFPLVELPIDLVRLVAERLINLDPATQFSAKHACKLFYVNLRKVKADDFCLRAALIGSLTLVKWGRERKYAWGNVCGAAAREGHLHVIQWARLKGAPWVTAATIAASHGQFDTLKWCVANGCPIDELLTSSAASSGRLDIVQWAYEQTKVWDKRTCMEAAAGGHFKIVKWAAEKGAPLGNVCEAAAEIGNQAIIEFARSQGAKWGETCRFAAGGGHLDLLKWARSNEHHGIKIVIQRRRIRAKWQRCMVTLTRLYGLFKMVLCQETASSMRLLTDTSKFYNGQRRMANPWMAFVSFELLQNNKQDKVLQ